MAINPTEASDGQYEMRMTYVRAQKTSSDTKEVCFEGAFGEICALTEGRRMEPVTERRRSEGALEEGGR